MCRTPGSNLSSLGRLSNLTDDRPVLTVAPPALCCKVQVGCRPKIGAEPSSIATHKAIYRDNRPEGASTELAQKGRLIGHISDLPIPGMGLLTTHLCGPARFSTPTFTCHSLPPGFIRSHKPATSFFYILKSSFPCWCSVCYLEVSRVARHCFFFIKVRG